MFGRFLYCRAAALRKSLQWHGLRKRVQMKFFAWQVGFFLVVGCRLWARRRNRQQIGGRELACAISLGKVAVSECWRAEDDEKIISQRHRRGGRST